MITFQALLLQVEMCGRALNINLEGFTDEEALLQPPNGGNSVNWIVGHIIASRQATLRAVKQQATWEKQLEDRYKRGSQPVRSADEAAASLAEMRAAFAASQEKLVHGLKALSEADLAEPAELFGSTKTRAEQIAFLQFHESYHVGQVGIMRRLVGKPGAIK